MEMIIAGLYLCLFNQGTLKVGRATNIPARLTSHRAAGARFGIGVIRTDVIPCDDPKKAEKLLLDWCAKNSSEKSCHEWFAGVDYEACLTQAKMIAASQMGPYRPMNDKDGALAALFKSWQSPMTFEAEVYCTGRKMMQDQGISSGVMESFDFLHGASEKVRAAMRLGCAMPDWFEELNCFEFWEIEIFMEKGRVGVALLESASDAIEILEGAES